MKIIVYSLIILISKVNCKAQEGYNNLNDTEYANVKFQEVSFEAIKATDGNVQAMRLVPIINQHIASVFFYSQ